GDGPLVAGDDLPPQTVAVLGVAMGSSRIALWVLDLDHLGAVVAEQHGGDRGGVHGPQVQDPDAGQRARGAIGTRRSRPPLVTRLVGAGHPVTPPGSRT